MRTEVWESFREWKASVFQRWWDMLNIPIAAIPLIWGIVQIVLWSRKAVPPLPIWDIGLLIGGVLLFVIVSFWAFHQMRVQRDKLSVTPLSDSEIKLMEWRREHRKIQTNEITQVPTILKMIWVSVADVLEEKGKNKCLPETLLDIVADVLDIKRDNKLLKAEHFANERSIKKSIKVFRAKMNLRKPNPKLEALWRARIVGAMDTQEIGLLLDRNEQYKGLIKQLETVSMPISKTKVYQKIDSFLDNLSALYSVKLLMIYGGTKKELYRFPREVRDILEHVEKGIEREMRTRFVQVKDILEEYSIGEALVDE